MEDSGYITALDHTYVLMLSGFDKPVLIKCYYPTLMLPEKVDRLFESVDQVDIL